MNLAFQPNSQWLEEWKRCYHQEGCPDLFGQDRRLKPTARTSPELHGCPIKFLELER